MIKDAKGRKWSMLFKHYREGALGAEMRLFKTRARAEEDARRIMQSFDAVAGSTE